MHYAKYYNTSNSLFLNILHTNQFHIYVVLFLDVLGKCPRKAFKYMQFFYIKRGTCELDSSSAQHSEQGGIDSINIRNYTIQIYFFSTRCLAIREIISNRVLLLKYSISCGIYMSEKDNLVVSVSVVSVIQVVSSFHCVIYYKLQSKGSHVKDHLHESRIFPQSICIRSARVKQSFGKHSE